MHAHAVFNQLVQLRPVPEVAGTAIDLMHHHTVGLPSTEELDHASELRPASFGGRALFLEPLRDRRPYPIRIGLDRGTLLDERYAFTLFGRGDTDVSKELLHPMFVKVL